MVHLYKLMSLQRIIMLINLLGGELCVSAFLVDLISSVECQIEHWRSGHRYECVETETTEIVKKPKR